MTRPPRSTAEPAWLRASRWVDRAYNAFEVLRQELALSRLAPAQHTRIVAERYSRTAPFYSDGDYLAGGLFPWESRAVSTLFPPPPARLLVGAAGAGRELLALAREGYQVAGFEPAEDLYRALDERARASEAASRIGPLLRGGYEDLAPPDDPSAAGPLAALRGAAPFDGVVLGWASLSHIQGGALRARLLPAIRALAPQAPVLLSFAPSNNVEPKGRAEAIRQVARRLLSHVPGAQPVAPGDHFGPYGYEHSYSEAELRELAQAGGYRITWLRLAGADYPHGVLTPANQAAGAALKAGSRAGSSSRP